MPVTTGMVGGTLLRIRCVSSMSEKNGSAIFSEAFTFSLWLETVLGATGGIEGISRDGGGGGAAASGEG